MLRSAVRRETKERVDLHLVEGEVAQAPEAGLAGAEIIERDAAADIAQHGHDPTGNLGIGHDGGFGDLDIEAARIEPGAVDDREHVQRRRGIDQLGGGKVEGQEDMLRPGNGGFGRLAQQRLRQRIDEAALFGQRHEMGRRDIAEIGMAPAGQRLEADDLGRVQIDDRLEMHIDLIGDDGIAQRLFHLRGAAHFLRDFVGIDGDLRAAAALGAIKRGGRTLQELVRLAAAKG